MSMSRERLLVVEDEADIREILTYNLRREGYTVDEAKDGDEALWAARQNPPDLILLDLMLPRKDGIEVCRVLKSDPALRNIPLIMVTALGTRDDVVRGLETGADDYVIKPFDVRELVSRVKAVLRRGKWNDQVQTTGRLVQGPLEIDTQGYKVYLDGELVQFTLSEFRLLEYLAANPGRVFDRGLLVSRGLNDAQVLARNVDVHIGSIRKKLGRHRDMIETVRGVGYRFKPQGSQPSED